MHAQTLCSIVIPVAPFHAERAREAIESAEAQTIPCQVVVEYDVRQTGAAAARNRALQRATGAFIVFLDADDVLAPTYVEECLAAWRQGGYVYTRERINGVVSEMPPCARWNPLRVYHYVTTFAPRAMVGSGFDTGAPIEDMDLYLRARFQGWKPIYLDRVLWDYRRDLGGSDTNPRSAHYVEKLAAAETFFKQRYGRYTAMGCCGGNTPKVTGDKQEGDAWVQALYSPRKVRGMATGRVYPRPDVHGMLWVDPRDVAAAPEMFHELVDVIAQSPSTETIAALVADALAGDEPAHIEVEAQAAAPVDVSVKPAARKPNARSGKRRK